MSAENIFVLINDVFFQSKIQAKLTTLNKKAKFYAKVDQIEWDVIEKQPSLLIVDLEQPQVTFNTCKIYKEKFKDKIYIIGFGAHFNTNLLDLAQKSGFDEAIPKSKFDSRINELLQKY